MPLGMSTVSANPSCLCSATGKPSLALEHCMDAPCPECLVWSLRMLLFLLPFFCLSMRHRMKNQGSGNISCVHNHTRCLQTHRETPGTLCYVQAGTIRETPSKTLQIASTDPRLSQRGAVGWSHLLMCQITLWRNGVLLCRVWD